jgi:predicted transposase YbfD/YdcC
MTSGGKLEIMKKPTDRPEIASENNTKPGELAYGNEGFVFEVNSLCAHLSQVKDGRKARGVRYSLTTLLTLMMLGKLSGHDRPEAIADWAQLRAEGLVEMLGLKRAALPHATTYGRVMTKAVVPADLEAQVKAYFESKLDVKEAVQICIDGKQIRGTVGQLSAGNTYLLGAYLPGAGVMLFQMAVGSREGELTIAPTLLKALDLQGKVITGDAQFTQRNLSLQIVEAGGNYLWKVKDNQPNLRKDIEHLFAPDQAIPGFSLPKTDFRTHTQTTISRGRIETRTLTASSLLKGSSNWPYLEQVFKLDTRTLYKNTGQIVTATTYGVTSLNAQVAGPKLLSDYTLAHWGIEGGSHQRRDVTFHEDHCDLRCGHAAHVMAVLNNIAIGLISRAGFTNAAHARRVFDAQLDRAFRLLITQS